MAEPSVLPLIPSVNKPSSKVDLQTQASMRQVE